MRKFKGEGYSVSYDIILNNSIISKYKYSACYSDLIAYLDDDYCVKFKNIYCEETKDYFDFYIKYICEMFKVKYKLDSAEKTLTIPLYKNHTMNLIFCSTLRMLWEGYYPNNRVKFFKNLKEGRCSYRNKLKRFCYFYSLIKDNYFSKHHNIASPKDIKIRSTQDFLKLKKIHSSRENVGYVHVFFESNDYMYIFKN